MGYYVKQAGGYPPGRLVALLDSYEAKCGKELRSEHPNIEVLLEMQELLEDASDDMGITILWVDRGRGLTAELSGKCFGLYHMPYADPDRS